MNLPEAQLDHRHSEAEEAQTDASFSGTRPSVRSAEIFRVKRSEISMLQLGQTAFKETGGLHAASLFTADGKLHSVREDVGRHNAVDKLLSEAFLQDTVPLRNHLLLLSERASFELLQKAVMGGIPMVAAIGVPSSLAIEVALEFSITLWGSRAPNLSTSIPLQIVYWGPNGTPYHC
jgi:formate dehydrogenase accessory protein FdhD